MVSVLSRKPRKPRWEDHVAMSQLKNDIERAKVKIFFMKHMTSGSTQAKWYSVLVDM